MSQKGLDVQFNLLIKKCSFYTKGSFYTPVFLTLTLFLILGFQNCTDQGVKELSQLNAPDTIAELSLGKTKHPDLLEISASIKGKIQDDFAAGSTVDLALSPSTHKNLKILDKSTVYTNWTIRNEAWHGYSNHLSYPCKLMTICELDDNGIEICTSTKASCYKPPVYETITTTDEKTQFQFSDVGVYDISAHIREQTPGVHPNTGLNHGPKYERSLVVGKCDQGDLQIITAKDPIYTPSLPTTTATQILNSITDNDYHDYPYYPSNYRYQRASRYASLFLLELDGKVLEFEDDSVYGGGHTNPEPLIQQLPTESVNFISGPGSGVSNDVGPGGSGVSNNVGPGSGVSNDLSHYYYGRKIKWNLMAEVIDPIYGRWYYKFNQQEAIPEWKISWPENDVISFYNSFYKGISTPGAKFSGKFIMEAFVQFPEGKCVYSAKKSFSA